MSSALSTECGTNDATPTSSTYFNLSSSTDLFLVLWNLKQIHRKGTRTADFIEMSTLPLPETWMPRTFRSELKNKWETEWLITQVRWFNTETNRPSRHHWNKSTASMVGGGERRLTSSSVRLRSRRPWAVNHTLATQLRMRNELPWRLWGRPAPAVPRSLRRGRPPHPPCHFPGSG